MKKSLIVESFRVRFALDNRIRGDKFPANAH